MVEPDCRIATDGTNEIVLKKNHFILVYINVLEVVLELGLYKLACRNYVQKTFCMVSVYDALGLAVALAIQFGSILFLDGDGHYGLACLGEYLCIIYQERLSLEVLVVFKCFRSKFVQGKHGACILLEGDIIVRAHVTELLCRHHLFHKFYGRIVLAAVFLLLGLDNHLRHLQGRGFQPDIYYTITRNLSFVVLETKAMKNKGTLAETYLIVSVLTYTHLDGRILLEPHCGSHQWHTIIVSNHLTCQILSIRWYEYEY